MRLGTLNSYSSSIAAFPNIIDLSDSRKQQNHIMPIFKKNSTEFPALPVSQNAIKANAFDQSMEVSNSTLATGEYNNLSVKQNLTDTHMARAPPPIITPPPQSKNVLSAESNLSLPKRSTPGRLNKFVRRLHEMLLLEQSSGIVEWRKGLLVLHSTDAFTKRILPKYFGTKNFKTFRRQLNYYGFVHVRSFSATGSTTTALWVNQDLAKRGTNSIASVLMLKRVEPTESSKTAEGRRVRKEEAASTVEDIGINTRTIQLEQIRTLAAQGLDNKQQEQAKVIKIDSNLIVPIISVQNCQESQTGTDSTSSNTSSRDSATVSSPVPASISITYPCTNSAQQYTPIRASSVVSNISVASNMNSSSQQTVSVSDTSTDDAANLLIMFSRSRFQMKS